MNPILESVYPDKTVLPRRVKEGLPPLPTGIDVFLTYLHEEMRACFLNGHDHAALVMACVVIEFALKDSIYFDAFVRANCVFDPDAWDQIDKLSFSDSIAKAKAGGVATKEEAKNLHWLRKHIRNVYLHGQTPPWLKDKDAEGIIQGNLETGEATEQTVKLRDHIVLQRHYRTVVDRNVCDQVVRLVDELVRTFVARSVKAINEWNAKNPSKTTNAQLKQVLDNMTRQGLDADVVILKDIPADLAEPLSADDEE